MGSDDASVTLMKTKGNIPGDGGAIYIYIYAIRELRKVIVLVIVMLFVFGIMLLILYRMLTAGAHFPEDNYSGRRQDPQPRHYRLYIC